MFPFRVARHCFVGQRSSSTITPSPVPWGGRPDLSGPQSDQFDLEVDSSTSVWGFGSFPFGSQEEVDSLEPREFDVQDRMCRRVPDCTGTTEKCRHRSCFGDWCTTRTCQEVPRPWRLVLLYKTPGGSLESLLSDISGERGLPVLLSFCSCMWTQCPL